VLAPRAGASRISEVKITLAIHRESTKMQQWMKSRKSCEQSRSMNDERRKHRTDVLTHDEIGDLIELGRLAIDND
jgi:hypothetical protein